MIPATPADKFPSPRIVDETEAGKPAQATTQRGTYTDKRTELDRIAAERDAEPRDPDADVPKVEPLPEVPGLFIFTTPVRSRKAGREIDRVTLRDPTARSLRQHGAFMKTTRRQWRDPDTQLTTIEETTIVDFSILAKHVADMSGLDVAEVDNLNGYDMMRMSLKIQEMMYTLPPT